MSTKHKGGDEKDKRFDYVRFDVGYHLHVCHRNTIMRYSDSVIARYVDPQYDTRKSPDDHIVIDRDGRHFGTILNYMRDPMSVNLDNWSNDDLTDLMREADFYCLVGLVEMCEKQFQRREESQDPDITEITKSLASCGFPPNNGLQMLVYGRNILKTLITNSTKASIIISYKNIRKLKIESWIDALSRQCDYSKFNVYCYAERANENRCGCNQDSFLEDLIMSLYESKSKRYVMTVRAPSSEKFKAQRSRYKCKIFKYWFFIQNGIID